jgi:hypothetical protein
MRHIYAKVETNFLEDARVRALTPPQFMAYLAVWLMAVEYQTEVLSVQNSDPTYIGRRANVNRNAVKRMLNACQTGDKPLLNVDQNGRVTVCGVTKLHPRLFLKGATEERREENIKKKEEKRTELETGKDLPLALSDQDLQKATALWEKHYGATSDQTTASIVKMLEDGGLDRTMYAIRECTKKPRQVPIAFARKVFNETEHRNKRKPEMVPIGDILAAKLEHAT